MNFKRSTNRKLVAWLAVFAVLLQAFMPTLSHAGAGKFSAALTEICTSTGLQSAVPDSNAPTINGHGDHCPYCFCAGGAALPSSQNTQGLHLEIARTTAFSIPKSNSKTAFILAARPRGPPTSSI